MPVLSKPMRPSSLPLPLARLAKLTKARRRSLPLTLLTLLLLLRTRTVPLTLGAAHTVHRCFQQLVTILHPEHLPNTLNLAKNNTLKLSRNTLKLLKRILKDLANTFTRLTSSLQVRLQRKLTPEEKARVLQQVYLEGSTPGERVVLALYRDRVVKVPIQLTPPSRFEADKPYFPPPSPSPSPSSPASPSTPTHHLLPHLRPLLFRIALPSLYTREALLVSLHTCFLALRTLLSIYVARLDGRLVRDLVRRDGRGFLRGLGVWWIVAVPSAGTNSMIRHLQSLLALSIRTRLTRYLHDLYLSSHPELRYFRATGGGAAGIEEGVDQYLTADVEAWAGSVSALYGNILKPSLDLILFTTQLLRSLSSLSQSPSPSPSSSRALSLTSPLPTSLLFLLTTYTLSFRLLQAASPRPSFAARAAEEAKLEGELRGALGRLGRESEEVAFYAGERWERRWVEGVFERVRSHLRGVNKARIVYEWMEDYVIKYLWSAAGYALIAMPILLNHRHHREGASRSAETDDAIAGRTETYISNRRLLLSLADAGGRLMYAYKDMMELAGLTERLYALVAALLHMPVPGGAYERLEGEEEEEVIRLRGVDVRVPRRKRVGAGAGASQKSGKEGEQRHQAAQPHAHSPTSPPSEPVNADSELDEPPLVRDLSLTLKRGEHLLITGSNGVGKTAVARVLAGLWEAEPSMAAEQHQPPGEGEGGSGYGYVHMPRDETEADVLVRRAVYEREREAANARQQQQRLRVPGEEVPLPPREHQQQQHWRPRPTLYVVPQRSYMPIGSLLEQIIYPCSYASFIRLTSSFPSSASTTSAADSAPGSIPPTPAPLSRSASISNLFAATRAKASSLSLELDTLNPLSLARHRRRMRSLIQEPSADALAEIYAILEKVHLGYLVQREGGLHVRKEWRDVLSGGEKQRMGMARVLWWRPRWAVLDECTSAVSSDVEGRMYEAAKAMDITLITISLRPSLMKYHTQLLTLLGPSSDDAEGYPGKWTLSRIGTQEERMSIQKEIALLEEKLKEVEGWERRVKELDELLRVQELPEDDEVDEGNVEEGEKEKKKGQEEEEQQERMLLEQRVAATSEDQESAAEAYTVGDNRYGVLAEDEELEGSLDDQELEVEAEIEAEAIGGESLA